jgi:hypothetical protein
VKRRRNRERKREREREKTILILLDFVGYYLCNLIVHHCLREVGVMSENKEFSFFPSFLFAADRGRKISRERERENCTTIYMMERLSGYFLTKGKYIYVCLYKRESE